MTKEEQLLAKYREKKTLADKATHAAFKASRLAEDAYAAVLALQAKERALKLKAKAEPGKGLGECAIGREIRQPNNWQCRYPARYSMGGYKVCGKHLGMISRVEAAEDFAELEIGITDHTVS